RSVILPHHGGLFRSSLLVRRSRSLAVMATMTNQHPSTGPVRSLPSIRGPRTLRDHLAAEQNSRLDRHSYCELPACGGKETALLPSVKMVVTVMGHILLTDRGRALRRAEPRCLGV